ncbi:hypothetical protein CERSUDRAFT_95813 [Gelatoporia subvermispora B]|uniref:Uncharacterized protein n=1 Tax=Ceriporiopsis subvermispora (strain B) TaxID=914234 RepID=M2RCJ7_CERS8|nr:hypothetical protein CERSUDRAFT_95813 [Gelatoporia subvermispora B]
MSDIPPSPSAIVSAVSLSYSPATMSTTHHSASSSTTEWATVIKSSTRAASPRSTAPTLAKPGTEVYDADSEDDTGGVPLSKDNDLPPDGKHRTRVVTIARPALNGQDRYEGHRSWDTFSDAYYEGDLYLSPKAEWLTTDQIIALNTGVLDGHSAIHERGEGIPNICVAFSEILRSFPSTRPLKTGKSLDNINDADDVDDAVDDNDALQSQARMRDSCPEMYESAKHRELCGSQKVGHGINARQVIYPTMAYRFAGPCYLYDLRTDTILDLDPPCTPIPGGIFALSIKTPRKAGTHEDMIVLELIILYCATPPAPPLRSTRIRHLPPPLPSVPPSPLREATTSCANQPSHCTPTPVNAAPLAPSSVRPPQWKGKEREPLSPSRASPPTIDLTTSPSRTTGRDWRHLHFKKIPASCQPCTPASAPPLRRASLQSSLQPARKRQRSDDPFEEDIQDYTMMVDEASAPATNAQERLGPDSTRGTPTAFRDAPPDEKKPRPTFTSREGVETVCEGFAKHRNLLRSAKPESGRFNITPTPRPGGFPPTHGEEPTHLTNEVPEDIAEQWEDESEEKVIVRPWGCGLGHELAAVYGQQTVDFFKEFYAIETLYYFLPNPPEPTGFTEPPFSMLLYGMAKEVKAAMLKQRVFSTAGPPALTIFVDPFSWCIPTYICTLRGFTVSDTARILRVIRRRVHGADFANLVYGMYQSLPRLRDLTPMEAVEETANGVEMCHATHKGPGGVPFNAWALYMKPPTTDPDDAEEFHALARSITYGDKIIGFSTVVDVKTCTGCHGVDHSRGMCPFTTIPNWHGLTPDQQRRRDQQASAKGKKDKSWAEENAPSASTSRCGIGRGAPSRRGRGRGGRY